MKEKKDIFANFLLAWGGGEQSLQLQSLESRAVTCSQTEPFDCFVPHCPYQGHGAELGKMWNENDFEQAFLRNKNNLNINKCLP